MRASPAYSSYVFLRDVLTRWVNSVFLSLLIANGGLHCWLFLSDFANPFWWRVVVLLRPPSVGRRFLWLVAALLCGLSLSFASGLSSPGLSCCFFTMCLRCADWLSLWLCVHSLLSFMVSWPSCLSLALRLALVFQAPVGSLLPYGSHPSRWGHPSWVEAVCPRSDRRFVCFPSPLGAVSSCCHCPWSFGHHMGQGVGWFPLMRDRRFSLVLHTFSFWLSFEPLSVAPLCARLLRGGFLVVLAVDESLRLSLALSSVLPCNMFRLHVCLHGTGSGP